LLAEAEAATPTPHYVIKYAAAFPTAFPTASPASARVAVAALHFPLPGKLHFG